MHSCVKDCASAPEPINFEVNANHIKLLKELRFWNLDKDIRYSFRQYNYFNKLDTIVEPTDKEVKDPCYPDTFLDNGKLSLISLFLDCTKEEFEQMSIKELKKLNIWCNDMIDSIPDLVNILVSNFSIHEGTYIYEHGRWVPSIELSRKIKLNQF